MKYTYPHTIENGAGEQLTFVRRVNDETGSWLVVHNRVQPGAGPPMHTHHFQDESLTVVQGKIGVQVLGGVEKIYGVGETLVFRRGEAHRFRNAGSDELLCEGWVKPADNIEYFLSEIYKSVKANGGHKPGAFDGAWLTTRYASEFEMANIPGFVKNVMFPIVIFFGKLSGKHKKFEGAPEPRKK